jgi:Flp pilus assembly protein TadG
VPRLAASLSASSRFRRDRKGVAALEFALILPVMLILYLGGFEVSDAVLINKKVSHATSVLGDLVTQVQALDDTEMSNILDATEAVVSPYGTTDFSILVMGVTIDAQSQATVTWRSARNATAPACGSAVVLPAGILQPSTFLVVADIGYAFSPPFGKFITGDIDLTDKFYLRPRYSNAITYPSNC